MGPGWKRKVCETYQYPTTRNNEARILSIERVPELDRVRFTFTPAPRTLVSPLIHAHELGVAAGRDEPRRLAVVLQRMDRHLSVPEASAVAEHPPG